MYWSTVSHFVSKTLFQSIPTYLINTLAGAMQQGYRSKYLRAPDPDTQAPTTSVFDLVNCGLNTRFHTSNGLILHNCLGLGYGMGPKKMKAQAYDNGFDLHLKDAKAFYKIYWDLFSDVRRLSDKLAAKVENDGYLVNPFGYRLTPPPFKALNYFIQSSVSGILHIYTAKLMAQIPWANYVTCIHDELILEVPKDRLDDFTRAKEIAVSSMNDDLGWDIKVRMGQVSGVDWFEAK